jgi:hypothetical protein
MTRFNFLNKPFWYFGIIRVHFQKSVKKKVANEICGKIGKMVYSDIIFRYSHVRDFWCARSRAKSRMKSAQNYGKTD